MSEEEDKENLDISIEARWALSGEQFGVLRLPPGGTLGDLRIAVAEAAAAEAAATEERELTEGQQTVLQPTLKILFNGRRLLGDSSLAALGIRDGDSVDIIRCTWPLLLTGHSDGACRLWRVGASTCTSKLLGHEGLISAAAFLVLDGHHYILSASGDGTGRLWSDTGRCLTTYEVGSRVNAIAACISKQIVLTGSEDSVIRMWDLPTGALITELTAHAGPLHAVAVASDDSFFLATSKDCTATLWSCERTRCLQNLLGHGKCVYAGVISKDSKLVATGSSDETARLWDVATGTCLSTLSGHDGIVRALAFSEDATLLISGSYDQTIRIWLLETQECIRTLRGHRSVVLSIALATEWELLFSGSSDNTAVLWDMNTFEILQVFEEAAGRIFAVAISQ